MQYYYPQLQQTHQWCYIKEAVLLYKVWAYFKSAGSITY